MSLASRFTEDEIFLLTTTPTQIGTVMAFSEGSGLVVCPILIDDFRDSQLFQDKA